VGKIVFGMTQSVDGYVAGVDGELEPMPVPGVELFRYWIDYVRDLAGSLYGRRLYEVMRYWDDDSPEWDASEREFAAAWRKQPKWVASRSLKSVGPNATLVGDDLEAFAQGLKAEVDGVIAVGGPDLAASLAELDLIDEYQLYMRPFVLGRGKPYFARARKPLRLVRTDVVGEDALRLTFVPA
jgi:dihydrofolate reductase